MRNLFSVAAAVFAIGIAVVSSSVKRAEAADGGAGDAGASPGPSGCVACVQCVAACTTAYADCTRKCIALPDFRSQQACLSACPAVLACAQGCPCSGCADIPGLPR